MTQRASVTGLGPYDLRLLESIELQRRDELTLEGCQPSVRDVRLASPARVDKSHLLDLGERLQDVRDAEGDLLLRQGAAQQRGQEERQDAVERVHADLLVRPMPQGAPADELGVFHPFERVFDVILTPIRPDNLLIRPAVLVGEEDVLTEQRLLQMGPGFLVDLVRERERRGVGERDADKVFQVTRVKHLAEGLLDRRAGAPRSPRGRAEGTLEVFEALGRGAEFAEDGRALGEKQLGIEGDHERAVGAQHRLARPVGACPRQIGAGERVKPVAGHGEQIRVLRGGHRPDEVIRRRIDGPLVVEAIVPFVVDQRDAVHLLSEQAIAFEQPVGDGREGRGIMGVAGVDVVEQRNMEIPRHEQGQADQAQVAALLLALAALGQRRGVVEAVDEGGKIRCVVEQATQIDLEVLDEGGGQVLLDSGNLRGIEVPHVLPEPLTGQRRGGHRQQTPEAGARIPLGEAGLAGGDQTPVQRGQGDVGADTDALRALAGVAVDRRDQIELGRQVIQGRGGSKLGEDDFDLLLLDIKMPKLDGLEVLRRLKATEKMIPVLILTAYQSVELAREAVKLGAMDYLPKPFERDQILKAVRGVLAEKRRV